MAAKKLNLVPSPKPDRLQPPRQLGDPGRALWQSITSEYDVRDAGGIEMLLQACTALDRAESLKSQIDADGEILRTNAGVRDHPGLKHEIAARSFLVRTLQKLGLDVEPIRPVGRPPGPFGRG